VADRPEPRYRQLLDADRSTWPSERLFHHYRRHFIGEVARGDYIADTLARFVPSGFDPGGTRVLDVGCGDGGVPIAFAYRGAEAAGLEPGRLNLRRARVRAAEHGVKVHFVRGLAEQLPFPPASRDLVILDNVLEHVTDRDRALEEIRRVLVPHGLLYLVTPKPFAPLSLMSDPHYGTPGLTLLPRAVQEWVIERREGPGAYDVGWIPPRRWVRRALSRHGFDPMADPRALWAHYVQDRIARPEEVQAGVKRRLAGWLGGREGLFRSRLIRWLLDVSMGANMFIARRRP
jgi:SAM-dependent methyltransferase